MSPPESAQQRLEHSRALVVQWLDQEQTRRDAFAHSGLGQMAALPWVRRIGTHPVASLAIGALTKWWMKPREARSSTAEVMAMGTGLGLLRRRPLLTLFTVTVLGTLAWWTQLHKRSTVRSHTPLK